jgi:hypothetical protein
MSTAVANTSIELLTIAVLELQAGASLSSRTGNLATSRTPDEGGAREK